MGKQNPWGKLTKSERRQIRQDKARAAFSILGAQGKEPNEESLEKYVSSRIEDRMSDIRSHGESVPDIFSFFTQAAISTVGNITIRTDFWADYGQIYARFQFVQEISLSIIPDTEPDALALEIEKKLRDANSQISAKIKNIPSIESFRKDLPNVKVKPFAMVRFLERDKELLKPGDISFQSLFRTLQSDIQETLTQKVSNDLDAFLKQKLAEYKKLPDGAAFAKRELCEVQLFQENKFTIKVTVSMAVSYNNNFPPVSLKKTSQTQSFFLSFLNKHEQALPEMIEEVERVVGEIADELTSSIILCQISAKHVLSSMLNPASQSLSNMTNVVPKNDLLIVLKADFPCTYLGNGKCQISKSSAWSSKKIDFSLADAKSAAQNPLKPGSKRSGPDNAFSFLQFCSLVDSLYTEFNDSHLPQKPTLTFEFKSGQMKTCTWNHGTIKLDDLFSPNIVYTSTLRTRIFSVFQMIVQKEEERHQRALSAAQTFSQFNPGELSMLKYMAVKKESWYSIIRENLSCPYTLTPDAVKKYLWHFTGLTIDNEEGKSPLITAERRTSKKHGDYTLYVSHVPFADEIFNHVTPRDFTSKEISDLTTSGQEAWFRYLLEKANDQQSAWKAFEALEHLSQKFTVTFAKSEEGQTFLSQFQGDDAVYVKYFLESLPGCKRLAASLFAKKGGQSNVEET